MSASDIKKYAFITGATGVIGGEFARAFAERGENLFLTGRDVRKLHDLKADFSERYPSVDIKFCAADLADGESRKKLYKEAEGLIFSTLVNAAGADIQKPFSEYDEEKLTFQIRACFESAVSVCNFVIANRAEKLQIINVSSICGLQPMPNFAVYAASKGALTQFSVALWREYKGKGVNVTAVLPGSVYTRPDVVQYIRSMGFWARRAAKSPRYVVEKSIKAVRKNKKTKIIGALNATVCFFMKFLPASVKLAVIERRWRGSVKDAF